MYGKFQFAYPSFIALLVLSALPFPAQADSPWIRTEQTDPMTDKTQIIYSTVSSVPLNCSIGNAQAKLHLTCGDKAVAILNAEGCVFEESNVFSYRIDKLDRSYISTEAFSSGQSVQLTDIASDDHAATRLIEKILTGDELLIRISPFAAQEEIVDFDIGGLKNIVTDEFKACFPGSSSGAKEQVPGVQKQNGDGAFESVGTLGPRRADSLESQILEELSCGRLPNPSPIFETLRQAGKVSFDANEGADSTTCFRIKGGLPMGGVTFTSVCGFEEDDAIRAQYPGLYHRGPGTSPGQFISFGTAEKEPIVRDWYKANLDPAKIDKAISSRFMELGASTEVGCTSWMFPPPN